MCDSFDEVATALGSMVEALDVRRLRAEDAVRLVDVLTKIDRSADAALTLAAGRVQETRAYLREGYATTARWLAARTDTRLADCITTVQTAHDLTSAPQTMEAFIAGEISGVQAREIAATVVLDPATEVTMLTMAAEGSVSELQATGRMLRAAAVADEDSTERIRRGRFFRHWIERDGAVGIHGRFAPDDGARLLSAVRVEGERRAEEARGSDARESLAAHEADALVALATGDVTAKPVVHVTVDHGAWERGRLEPGETCRIEGVGPVSVSVARRLADDGIVKLIERDGVDVTRVAHLGRTIPAHVRSALEARDTSCVVPGCDVRTGLEIDHIVPFAEGGPTALHNLARLCRFHHAAKTHHGWVLGGQPGARTWTRRPDRGQSRPGRPPPRAP